jgi:uridine kinase
MFDLHNFLATHQPKNGRFFTITIDGRGGCGKSTLAELLKSKLPGFVVLNGDDYFEPIDDPVVWGEFNDDRFASDVIAPLKNGNSFMYRPYDWHAEPHITEQQLEVTKGFCLERCYSFKFDLDWDIKIWVETPKEVCLERGLTRESMPREKTISAWKIWQQQEDDYIRDFKPQEKADVVIDGTKPFKEQI